MDLSRTVLPFLRALGPEVAHDLTLRALALGLAPIQREPDDPILRCRVFGLDFPNPVGLAAGFDKNAAVFRPMLRLGFGFVEVGTITPRPQKGNPKPRIFRLAQDQAVINRLGFNNNGMAAAARNLSGARSGLVGVNIGINKDSADPVADYAAAARRLGPLADYLVVNVSSPNTPGLRALQDRGALRAIVEAVAGALDESGPTGAPPLLVKIAPDLGEAELADIADVALSAPVAGLIIGNTTIARPPGLSSRHRDQTGGLSGGPLFESSTSVLRDIRRLTEGRLPLIGVGGVASGAAAYEKIRAGSSLVQLYTALIYRGPGLVRAIKEDLARRLRADGFETVAEATGTGSR